MQTLIKAQRHGVYADFKIDGTYVIKTGSWGSKVHLYGVYTLRNSIIEIDKCCVDEIITSSMFLIRNSIPEEEIQKPDYDKLSSEKYLVQIDKSGNEIKARHIFEDVLPYRFEVVADQRK